MHRGIHNALNNLINKRVLHISNEQRVVLMGIDNRLLVKDCIDQLGDRMDGLSQLFFRELFHLDINLKHIFKGNVVFLNRKFSSMMGTLRDVKYLEKIRGTLLKMGERHLLSYGAQIEHLETVHQALIVALKTHLDETFTPELENAWNEVLGEITAVMAEAMRKANRRKSQRNNYDETAYDPDLLQKIGGKEMVLKVHQRFYEVMFNHPWLGRFFGGKNQSVLARKQTEFMVAAFGGPNDYKGDTPAFVHMHMLITDEQADLRESILRQAMLDEGLPEDIADRWLKMDTSFRQSIVKKSADECILKCVGQAPLVANKPEGYE